MERARVCYERALVEEPTLSGRIGVLVHVRGGEVSVELEPAREAADAHALDCCVEHAHEGIATDLPRGARATARYTLELGAVVTGDARERAQGQP